MGSGLLQDLHGVTANQCLRYQILQCILRLSVRVVYTVLVGQMPNPVRELPNQKQQQAVSV